MLASEVEIGATYSVRWHDGSIAAVRIIGTQRYPVRARRNGAPVIGTKVRYRAMNLATGRYVTIKSASKLRSKVG